MITPGFWSLDPDEVTRRRLNWLTALESGWFLQAQENLHLTISVGETLTDIPSLGELFDGVPRGQQVNLHCCLGVACHLMDKGKFTSNGGYTIEGVGLVDSDGEFIPADGIYHGHREDGFGSLYGLEGFLGMNFTDLEVAYSMNDEGKSFQEIAAYFRQQWGLPGST